MANEAVVVGLLEDDRDQADLYRAWLEQAGFLVRAYAEVKDFRRRLAEIAEQAIVINDTHYGRVEDAHMGICHMACYAFMEKPELVK